MVVVFGGRRVAFEKLGGLTKEVENLKEKGIIPKLVSFLVGDDPGSELYLSLKKKAAEKIGVELEIKKLGLNTSMNRFIDTIQKLNKRKDVHGIMIQLPLPENLKHKTEDLIECINPKKDVDGMREDSPFVAPVVKAVVFALGKAIEVVKEAPLKVVVVGKSGFVGDKIAMRLEEMKYKVDGLDSRDSNLGQKTENADVVISATGVGGIIKADMVKPGVVLIDVGSPKGDIEEGAYEKASFVSPVPGGVGPLTIFYLLENLIGAVGG